ncbi:KH domain-containing protein [Candidatus Woesebacteria bacterium]|nr:MAG: KH domain-containing protein [Candidatus Woesebacteria bacterium]
MKELLHYILTGILGNDNFEIREVENENNRLELTIVADKENMGLIIGKGGSTIKAIRNLLRVKSTLDKTSVYVLVEEKID